MGDIGTHAHNLVRFHPREVSEVLLSRDHVPNRLATLRAAHARSTKKVAGCLLS